MEEFGIAQAQPVVNPTAGKIANLLRQAKEFGNQYEIRDYVPFFGGTGLGDLFLGQAPEEVNRWSYGDYPFRNPSSVVGTGGNRLDVWKTGRFEPTFDVVANVGLPAVGTAQMVGKPLAKALAPKAGEMAENYLRTVGGIADVAPVGPKPQELAQALRMPEKNELGFYSPLDEAVMNLQNPKGTGQQYLAQLLKTQGVKQEEVSTRGLDTFLANNPKVTREEIAQYLRDNPVTLKEKVLDENYEKVGNFDDYQLRGGDVIDDTAYMDDLANDEYFRIKSDESDLISELKIRAYNDLDIDPATNDLSELNKIDDYVDDAVREQAEQYARDVYYENPYRSYYDDLGYEVTGNDDIGYYIKDPQGREVSTGRSGIYDISDVESRIREDALDRGLLTLNEEGPKYADYVLPNGENYREVLIQYPNTKGGDYQSGHFDEPNILAHMRVTDRDIDGKKTLFIEEIQSDWHQAGRKKGYKTGGDAEKQYENLMLEMSDKIRNDMFQVYKQSYEESPELVRLSGNKPIDEMAKEASELYLSRLSFEDLAKQAGKFDDWKELKGKVEQEKYGVPDAPFKKNWQELAMKRAMQMAAEGGYERVAFTTGKQQAERYSLSKQVNDLTITRGPNDFTIHATDKNGRPAIMKTIPDLRNLDDFVGKDLANKIKDDFANKSGQEHTYSGLDLDVGGEGMKGFYDKILPDFINKYGKKHGLKVGQTNLKAGRDTGNFDEFVDWAGTQDTGRPFSRKELMDMWESYKNGSNIVLVDRYMKSGADVNQNVHYFDLTPEAKESFIKKGQPLFAVPPAMAITDEESRRETLERLFNNQK